ncbi:MAG: ribosome biogenesis GTPase YlqF [Bacilli bacterium]|nr:ribosome biogenesis GTPase YlqF [Bacilli bacterium]
MNNENKTNINWFPGHMAKTKREIREKLELIDIVYEVIDSRMPRSSRIVDLDDLIKDKPRIIIATKYDLCDSSVTDKILNEYNSNYPVIKCNLKDNSNIAKIIVNKTEELLKSINEKRTNKGLFKRSYRALVIGVPNAGKSTLINRLAGKNVAKTGNIPGVTKNLLWIKLNKDLELLDTPGILWPKIESRSQALNLASLASIKEEILDKEEIANYIIDYLYNNYPQVLKEKYKVDKVDDNTFDFIGRHRGCLMKGNIVDLDKVYTLIINDLKDGRIKRVTFDK